MSIDKSEQRVILLLSNLSFDVVLLERVIHCFIQKKATVNSSHY